MKKMIIAIVAMFAMTMSANAQSVNDSKLTFDRLSSYLDLTINQVEPVKKAMAQLAASTEACFQLKDGTKTGETWEIVQDRHKKTMKNLLSEKQYNKYEQIFDLTVKNTADRMMDEATAAK